VTAPPPDGVSVSLKAAWTGIAMAIPRPAIAAAKLSFFIICVFTIPSSSIETDPVACSEASAVPTFVFLIFQIVMRVGINGLDAL
jgi:hypothetical protein